MSLLQTKDSLRLRRSIFWWWGWLRSLKIKRGVIRLGSVWKFLWDVTSKMKLFVDQHGTSAYRPGTACEWSNDELSIWIDILKVQAHNPEAANITSWCDPQCAYVHLNRVAIFFGPTPQTFNMDTKHDGLENVSPASNMASFWVSMWISGGYSHCKHCLDPWVFSRCFIDRVEVSTWLLLLLRLSFYAQSLVCVEANLQSQSLCSYCGIYSLYSTY